MLLFCLLLNDLRVGYVQGDGLGGPIAATALCGLAALRVLALSHNMLNGELPPCMASLQLAWLWADGNRFHGPVSVFSALGQVSDQLP